MFNVEKGTKIDSLSMQAVCRCVVLYDGIVESSRSFVELEPSLRVRGEVSESANGEEENENVRRNHRKRRRSRRDGRKGFAAARRVERW